MVLTSSRQFFTLKFKILPRFSTASRTRLAGQPEYLLYLYSDGNAVEAQHGGPGQANRQGDEGEQAGQPHRQQAVQPGEINRGGQVRQAAKVQVSQRQLYLHIYICKNDIMGSVSVLHLALVALHLDT
jgi:hypothetical protein